MPPEIPPLAVTVPTMDKPEVVNDPINMLLTTTPNVLVEGRYRPVLASPTNLSDGTANDPLPNVIVEKLLAVPDAAL